jgi:hypothetical protein
MVLLSDISLLLSVVVTLRAKCVIVQNRNKIQKPDAMQFKAFIIIGTASGDGASIEARRANIIKSGAPGG